MNSVHARNNRYKNGEWNPSRATAIARAKASSIEPTQKQVQYRDDLYKFCIQKGLVGAGFKILRTKQGITSNIRALITILKKNGFDDEFFGCEGGKDNGKYKEV